MPLGAETDGGDGGCTDRDRRGTGCFNTRDSQMQGEQGIAGLALMTRARNKQEQRYLQLLILPKLPLHRLPKVSIAYGP